MLNRRKKERIACMRINKVEELVGITKKNIRFYEEKGLLNPERNTENGYRMYRRPLHDDPAASPQTNGDPAVSSEDGQLHI